MIINHVCFYIIAMMLTDLLVLDECLATI